MDKVFSGEHRPLTDYSAYDVTPTATQSKNSRPYHSAYLKVADIINVQGIKNLLEKEFEKATEDRQLKLDADPNVTPNFKPYQRLVAALVIFLNIDKWQYMTPDDICKTLYHLLARRMDTLQKLMIQVRQWLKPQLFAQVKVEKSRRKEKKAQPSQKQGLKIEVRLPEANQEDEAKKEVAEQPPIYEGRQQGGKEEREEKREEAREGRQVIQELKRSYFSLKNTLIDKNIPSLSQSFDQINEYFETVMRFSLKRQRLLVARKQELHKVEEVANFDKMQPHMLQRTSEFNYRYPKAKRKD